MCFSVTRWWTPQRCIVQGCTACWLQVQYSALPNFEEREEEFRAESVILRRRFTDQGTHATKPFCIQPHEPHVTDSRSVDNSDLHNLKGEGLGQALYSCL